jgi:hypothetical protein
MKTIIKSLFKTPQQQDSYHQLTRSDQTTIFRLRTGHNRINQHLNRVMKIIPSPMCSCGDHTIPDVLLWRSYHPRCAVQCKIPPHLTNMNHQALREEAITNNTPGEALWTHGCPTEDHQIRSGNWNLSVKANEKKNLTQTGILLIKSIQSLLIYCSLTSNQHYFSQLIDWL